MSNFDCSKMKSLLLIKEFSQESKSEIKNIMAVKESKFSRRTIALFWLLTVGILVGFLIYLEQIALLYVFATLGLVTLLLIVGFADLEKVGRENAEVFAAEDK